jgi:glucosyl-3-phosphoglycerate synthase
LTSNAPADIAIYRLRPYDKFRRILVPIAGGPNSRLAVHTALAIAKNTKYDSQVLLVHVIIGDIDSIQAEGRAKSAFRYSTHGLDYTFEEIVLPASSPVEGILEAASYGDLIIIGATKEPRFRNLLMGNVAQRVAEGANSPVIIVKRQSTVLDSMLRENVLTPIRRSDKLAEAQERAKVSD